MRSLILSQCRDLRMCVICDMRRFRPTSFKHGKCKTVLILNLLEAIYLRLGKIVVVRVTVVKFRVDNKGSNRTGCIL